MTEQTGTVFGKEATGQIAKTVREVSRRLMNEQPHRARWQNHNGGKGAKRIRFTINSVTCNPDDSITLNVTVTWYTGGCAVVIPGADEYDIVTVEDPCGIANHYTVEFLESGVSGTATYMYPRAGDCVPEWQLDDICGTPECS